MIHRVPNLGRDLGPLVELAGAGVFDGYDAILKVHTKRSPHRIDGDAWRVALLDGLMPSPEGIRRIVELLRSDRSVGLVVPTGHVGGRRRGALTRCSSRRSLRESPSPSTRTCCVTLRVDVLGTAVGSPPAGRSSARTDHFEPEAGHVDGSTAHALERFVGVAADASGLDLVETDDVSSRLHRARRRPTRRPRVLAFYLPQFHQIPENDAWWGTGFTDWANVDRARPLYEGHSQPVEPGELGRYDLSDPEVMRSQAALAAEHGVDGFVMHHYWFDGRKLLDTPLRNLLDDPSIEFPFALCWANENWTRRWDGLDSDVLIAQSYSEGWADRFYDDILPGAQRPAVHHGRRSAAARPLSHRAHQEPVCGDRTLEGACADDGLGGLHVLAVSHSRHFEGLPRGVEDAIDGLVHFPPLAGIELQSVKNLAPAMSSSHSGDVYSYDAAVNGAEPRDGRPHGLRIHPGDARLGQHAEAS